MKTIHILAAAAVLATLPVIVPGGASAAAAGQSPVVVELFTSQGCSSCPPADRFLGELAKRDGVLALSMHIDYWDGLGWKDPYSSPAITARQRAYATVLGGRYVYTPEAVVGGRGDAVGSRRAAVESLIRDARAAGRAGPSLILAKAAPGKLAIRIGAGAAKRPAAVWLIAFDDRHTTEIPSGENAGRTIVYYHVVRALRRVGQWTGRPLGLSVDVAREAKAGYDELAVLVQEADYGPILAAASRPVPPLH